MKTRTLLTGALAAGIAIVSCNKDEGSGPLPTPPGNTSSLSALFQSNVANATQNFTVDAASGGWVQGTKGTIVSFNPNAFLDQAGNPVSGQVDIELIESPTIGDMLWLNKQTVGINSSGQQELLVSGGQIYLNATQNGNDLRLTSSGSWVNMVDATPDPNMQLFSGTTDSDGNILWDPFNPTGGNLQTDSLGYNFPNDSLGWINCDYFNNTSGPLTDVSITVPSGYDDQNTICWVAFPTINSITNVYNYANNVFSITGGYQVPVGFDIVIVCLHDAGNGNYESSFTPVTVTAGMNQSVTFQTTTLAQFQIDCNGI